MKRYRFVSRLILCVAAVSSAAADVTSRPTDPAVVQLAERQAVVLSRLTRWEDRLYQLSQVLQKTEPEHAARLLDALSNGRNMLLRKQAQDIIENLRTAKLSDASDQQEKLIGDLTKLLKVLLDENAENKDHKQDREELLALRERINQLIKEQESELKSAQEAAAALAQLQAAEQKVADLLKQQQDLSAAATTAKDPAKSAELGKSQAQLGKQTESLAGSMKQATQPADQKAAEAAPSLEKAAEAMKQAGDKLQSGEPSAANPPQAEAEKELKNALQRLKEEREALEKKLELEKQAKEQKDTAQKTDSLAKKMDKEAGDQSGNQLQQPGGQQQPGNDQKPGQEGQKPSDDKKQDASPKAGSQQVRDAVPHQQKAAQKLDEKKPSDAAKDQKKALDKLQQAKQEIEDALEQLRKEQQEELLAALETRFAAMLAKQIETNKRTNRLDSVGKDKWSRADQLELVNVSKQQSWVSDEADSAMKILKEDGTTIVVPQIIEQVRDDSREAAKRLSAADTGTEVRQIQESIVSALQDLLDAVREMQKKQEKGESGNQEQGDPDSNPPLLPGSAELKLLKSWQVRVNRTTDDIQKQRTTAAPSPDINDRINQAAKRQAAVAQMARDLVEGEQSRPPVSP